MLPLLIFASSGSTVAYDRTFTVGRKSTVCLPFALTEAEVTAAGTFYKLTSAADGTLTFSEVSETEAYKPYVFEAKKANPFANLTGKAIAATPATASGYATTVDGYTFQGVLAHQELSTGVYGYSASTGDFKKNAKGTVKINAFRAYIKSSGEGAPALNCVFGDENITGIETVKTGEKENDTVYNLAGQRVSANHKGLVIKNGRKYFVK